MGKTVVSKIKKNTIRTNEANKRNSYVREKGVVDKLLLNKCVVQT